MALRRQRHPGRTAVSLPLIDWSHPIVITETFTRSARPAFRVFLSSAARLPLCHRHHGGLRFRLRPLLLRSLRQEEPSSLSEQLLLRDIRVPAAFPSLCDGIVVQRLFRRAVDAGHALLAVMKKDRPFLSHLNVCHWAVHRGGGDGWVPGHSHPHSPTGYLMSNFPEVNFCQNGNCPCKNVIEHNSYSVSRTSNPQSGNC